MIEAIILLAICLFMIIYTYQISQKQGGNWENKKNKAISILMQQHNVSVNASITFQFYIALFDIPRSKLIIANFINVLRKDGKPDPYLQEVFIKDILKCELIKDGVTTLNKSTTDTLGRAIVGGALAGGLGAMVGSNSGKSTSTSTVTSAVLKIHVNDFNNPIIMIPVFSGKNEPNKEQYLIQAETLCAKIDVLCRSLQGTNP